MPKKMLQGKVVSTKMKNTVAVSVAQNKRHPLYKKPIRSTTKLLAHDELGCKEGNMVIIEESRPFSKRVNFVVKQILEQVDGTK